MSADQQAAAASARLEALDPTTYDGWRASREAGGRPLPEDGQDLEALGVWLGEVPVGAVVLSYDDDGGARRCSIRELETGLPVSAEIAWSALLAAVERHAAARGARILVTTVPAGEVRRWADAGWVATMTSLGKRLGTTPAPALQEDRRVEVRPMDAEERVRFVAEAGAFLREGMVRAGVTGADAPPTPLEQRLLTLTDDPPSDPPSGELLMTGTVDGVPVGRVWLTLARGDDGVVEARGNTLDLFPEHRGQGLTRSLLGAMARHVRTLGVRDVSLRTYAHDRPARETFSSVAFAVTGVTVRKDLPHHPPPHPKGSC